MAEFSERSTRDAERIVDQLLSDETPDYIELDNDIVILDVQRDAINFSAELEFLKRIDADVPAIGTELGPIPVSLQAYTGAPGAPNLPQTTLTRDQASLNLGYLNRYYRPWLRLLQRGRQPQGMVVLERSQAQRIFTRRVVDFLATRITAVRDFRQRNSDKRWARTSPLTFFQQIGGRQITTPGCHFTVSTNSGGLRVFWSGAYYISQNFFSHPTTPVASVLQTGSYVFGVDGGAYGNVIQWDTNAIVTLPGMPFVHLNF